MMNGMPTDLSATNAWLALLAICALLQLAAVVVAGVYVVRTMRAAALSVERTLQAVDGLMRRTEPLLDQLSVCLTDIHDLASRIQRANDAVESTSGRLSQAWARAKAVARWRLWPILAAARGAQALVAAWTSGRPTPTRATDDAAQDRMAESRFLDEGGAYASHAR
jgi:uncharacterized protein YoxC